MRRVRSEAKGDLVTLPNQRTRAVLATRDFLVKVSSPYGGGYKKIPTEVRQAARALLRHYPYGYDLVQQDSWDERTVEEFMAAYEDRWGR